MPSVRNPAGVDGMEDIDMRLRSILPMAVMAFAWMHLASAADLQESFTIGGDVGKASTWDAARINHDLGADIQTVHYTLKGHGHVAHCVPLLALIDNAVPAVNPNIK